MATRSSRRAHSRRASSRGPPGASGRAETATLSSRFSRPRGVPTVLAAQASISAHIRRRHRSTTAWSRASRDRKCQ